MTVQHSSLLTGPTVCVFGTGYVGLVQAIGLANFGFQISCIDVDPDKIKKLNQGKSPIYEQGIDRQLKSALGKNLITFTTDISRASNADIIFIAVGTPEDKETGHADLTFLQNAIRDAMKVAKSGAVLVIKSTVPVGTNQRIQKLIDEDYPNSGVSVVSNPEFLREGSAVADFAKPDRIVLGGNSKAIKLVRSVYAELERQGVEVIETDMNSAELIKYASNAFLATKIAFINDIANLTENIGGDIQTVAKGIGLDERIGGRFLRPGPGFGGSCFPKDTQALAAIGRTVGSRQRIVEVVISENAARTDDIALRIKRLLGNSLTGKIIGVLGLAFKAGTDDVRFSPAVGLIKALIREGAIIRCYDPVAKLDVAIPNVTQCDDTEDLATNCHGIVIATEWPEFGQLDYKKMKERTQSAILYDTRNICDPAARVAEGWTVQMLGSEKTYNSK